jgi:PKD repeat protein
MIPVSLGCVLSSTRYPMKPTFSRLSILVALIIGLLLIGSVCAAEQENVTLEITPAVTLELTPEITTDVTAEIAAEITTEITPDLRVTELFAADDLPALEAAGDPLEANFTQNRTYGPAPLPIQFYDRSTGTPTNWSWDFGDGATSDLKNPRHTYASAGTYTVTLVVSDGVSSDTYEVPDRIRADTPVAPVAALSANKTSWSSPAAVQFYDRSTGYPVSWNWDFGDDATATVKNPVHTYTATGNYTVSLSVTNDLGTDTIIQTEYFHAYDPVAPTAALSANKTSWSSPPAVQFYDRSAGFPTSWNWDFGDGATSTVKNPVHTYAATGNYTVTLSVTNDLGSDTIVQNEYFHAYDPVAPVAALSANKTSWSSPAAVQFYDRSTGFPISWAWDFGDGATATVKNPVHTYTTTGNYTVTLTVTNDLGSNTKVQTEYFHTYDPVAPTAALSANKTSWSSPAAVQFYDRSAGFPTSWSWDFGDGATSIVKNPVHTYAATGNYTVTLSVTNDLGTDTITQAEYFHAYDPVAPTAALSANKTSWSSPAAVQFYDRSTGFPTSWSWDFGDGTTAMVKNPVHTYEATGNYTVTLTVTNDLGTDTKVQADFFHAYDSVAPVAAISANKTSWSAPAAIQFYDRSTGFPTAWAWDFGDGATSTVKNPVHTFEATGNYTVILTATNDLGSDTKTATDYIVVSGSSAPVAALSANKTSWSAPAAIQFYDRSTGFPTAWAWDFGDGATATVKNPVHTYTGIGNYTVNLTVTNEVGSDTKVAADYIKVSGSAAPLAAISANKTSWSSPAAIQFYDRSTGFPTSWAWDFGDGTTAAVKNPVHTYTGIGNYTVNLTVTNEVGSDTKVMPDYIRVSVPEIPVAKLSANRTAGPAPIVIQFYDRSIGFPTSWFWDFGDGTNSTLKNPVHMYSYGGNYTIRLTAANALGNTTVTALNYIKASGTGPTPVVVAAFTANATSGQAPFAVAFTDLSTGLPTRWNWSFGDGEFSILQNPGHTYTTAGNFTVSLTAGNTGGENTTTMADLISVTETLTPVYASFSVNATTGTRPLAVRFADLSTGNPTNWTWDFGDGFNSTEQEPEHVYTSAGNFTVQLTVEKPGSSNITELADLIRVTEPAEPVAVNFTASVTEGLVPLTVNFTDLSTGSPVSWNWSFGDGNFSEIQHPSYIYPVPGIFTVNLTIGDGYGVNDTLSMPDYITVHAPAVVANFTVNATAGQAPFAVAFSDLSTGSPTSWNWSFGDGTFSEVQNPVHTYAGAGNYTVSLAATNAFTSDTRTVPEYVIIQPATSVFDASVESLSVSSAMFQGEHYLVDIRMNNTGTRAWSGNPASPDYVYLEGVGGSTGDAAKFNLTQIPMLFVNETVAPGEGYDFFFFMEAPEIIGNYSPAFQMTSYGYGPFGEIPNSSVSVIENPFNPVVQPDGSKLYTTTFGNLSSGMTVSIVGPKVYLDKLQTSSYQDPRFLINPSLKSGVFDFKLNDTFNYADITVKYDPAKVSNPANLSISYFNTTTGNFTFVPSTVDTVNHTVTARVTHFSIYEVLDQIKYMALPFFAQNDMGYRDMGSNDNWTINPPLGSISGASFNNGENFPPGNYTIYTSGTYSNNYLDFAGTCYGGWAPADSNFDGWSGMYIVYNNPSGLSERQVKTVRYADSILKITHGGGPIRLYNRPVTGRSCGAVSYKMYYTGGPVFRDPLMDYSVTLLNNAVFLKQAGFEGAYNAYMRGLGCLIAKMGDKGNMIIESLFSLPLYSKFLGNDIQNIGPFTIGYSTCGVAPLSDFNGDPTNGVAPLMVQFTDNSLGLPSSWQWDFGDGITSSEQNPSHSYTTSGMYTVRLTTSNYGGSNTRTKVGYITITATPVPVTDFTGTPTTGTVPLTVQFTDKSTGSSTSWAWDFNNDGTTDSTVQNPTFTYAAAGSYSVKLTATNIVGSNSKVKPEYIIAMVSGEKPQASDYDFQNIPDEPNTNTVPSASAAAAIQNLAGYQAKSFTNASAETAYSRLQEDALFMFIGHGLKTTDPITHLISDDKGGGLLFYDGSRSYLLAQNDASVPQPDRRYISNIPEQGLEKARLVVLLGCYTGDDSPTRGNLVTAISGKGAQNVIGWNGPQVTPQLQSWSTHFWTRVNNGESFYSATHNAADDAVFDYPLGLWDIERFTFVSKNGDSYLKPAGYGN